jgi:ATP-binding protein involved in chromosome partitioning
MGIAFLGGIPLEIGIREASDAGTPVALRDDPAGNAFRRIAVQVLDTLKETERGR